jgi:hypothetical protein
MARTLIACAAVLLLAVVGQAETLDGHDESWWRAAQAAHESAVRSLEQSVSSCEKTEAPVGAGVVEGYGVGRVQGRPVLVPLKRCDDERARLDAARADLERFEDQARQLGVPPGWLR